MHTRSTLIALLVLVPALSAVVGCNSVSTTTREEIGAPKFPPTDPAKVEILRAESSRPHVRLGEIRADAPPDGDVAKVEEALRKAAAALGADAIVILSDRVETTGAMVTGGLRNRSVEATHDRVVVATAIKYK